MQVSFEKGDKFQIIGHVTVEGPEVKPIYDRVLKQYVSQGKIDGFRKGKIPVNLIKSHFALSIKTDVYHEVLRTFIPQITEKPEVQHSIDTPSVTNIGDVKEDQDFTFDVIFTMLPEIEIKPLNEISVNKLEYEVTEDDINYLIENMRKQLTTFRTVDDAAADENYRVTLDFVGKIDGEPFENGAAKNFNLVINGNSGMISGFADQVKGHKAGDKFDINVSFPEDYHVESLRSKPAVFECEVKAVAQPIIPNDEEFLKHFNQPNLDAMKGALKENVARECNLFVENANWNAVVEALVKNNVDFELPQVCHDRAADALVKLKLNHLLSMIGNSAHNNKLINNLKENMRKDLTEDQIAEKARSSALVEMYITKCNLNDTPVEDFKARVDAYLESIASAYDTPNEYIAEIKKDPNQMRNVYNNVNNTIILESFLSKMNVTVEKKNFTEIQMMRANSMPF